MPRSHLIVGLDIGTSKIKALVAKKSRNSELEVLAFFQEPALGVRRGVVVNTEEVSEILQNILDKIQSQIGQKLKSAYVNIGGSHVFCTSSHGTVAVSRADKKISEEDIDRVLEAAQTFSLASNKEILDLFPQHFIVDGEKVKKAVEMEGVRLESEVLVICGFSPYFRNLTKTVVNTDLQISEVIPGPVAAARACLTPRQKELGVALLDIGAGTSGLAVYEEGNLIHLAILPMGSANITNDIAIGLRTDINIAERIKKEFGSCDVSGKSKKKKIEIREPEHLVFTQKKLVNIIKVRVSEIFEQINKELKKISRQGLLPAGVVLTGGGSKLPKIVGLAKKELKLPCRIGKVKGILNIERDPMLSTVSGLVLEGSDLEETEDGFSSFGRKINTKIKSVFKSLIP